MRLDLLVSRKVAGALENERVLMAGSGGVRWWKLSARGAAEGNLSSREEFSSPRRLHSK
jgi:hypothetical protein